MKQRLYQTIAAQLEQTIRSDPAYTMPSIRLLAQHYGISIMTMWKAVHVLVDKGLVRAFKGVNIARTDAAPSRTPREGSSDQLYRSIRSRIVEGTYQTGEAISKLGVLVAGEHVSRPTVVRALQRLSRENLIHKTGRRWTVGPASSAVKPVASWSNAPTVLLIVPDEISLNDIFVDNHVGPFVNSFHHEFVKAGLSVQMAVRNKPPIEFSPVPRGPAAIRSEIQRLGPYYRGSLLIDKYLAGDEFAAWVSELSLRGTRPVVDFDSSAAGAARTRSTVGGNRAYHRLFLDESAAVRAAVREIADAGHNHVGVPVFGPQGPDWAKRRVQLIEEAASAISPALSIRSCVLTENFFLYGGAAEVKDASVMPEFRRRIGERLAQKMSGAVRGNQQALLDITPSLVALLRHEVTALICLNDWLADQLWLWLKMAGIDVPSHLSMISFDNHPQGRLFPVSSVDFGFPRLGYLAAHIFIDDIPITADATGGIAGRCTVVNRGSIAAPTDPLRLNRIITGYD